MTRCEAYHFVFFLHSFTGQRIFLVVYVDDIIITINDIKGIQRLKTHLFNSLQTKYSDSLKYFLGIDVAQTSIVIAINQRKYTLNILNEIGIIDYRPIDTPTNHNAKLLPGQDEAIEILIKLSMACGKMMTSWQVY